MAVTQNTLIGRSRGSVGGTTFSKWKGLNVLKSKPESVEQPNTIGQQTQKNRMALIVQIGRGIKPALDAGFKEQAINQSEFNAFVSENIMTAINAASPPAVTPNFAALEVSKGSLSNTLINSIVATFAQADVEFNFSNTATTPDQSLTDLAVAVVINTTSAEVAYIIGADARSTGQTIVTMPSNLTIGDNLECYLFFVKEDYSKASDSQYDQVTV